MKVENLFNNFEWVWSVMPKMIQSNDIAIPQICFVYA